MLRDSARRTFFHERRHRDTLFAATELRHEKLRCVACGDKVFAIIGGKPHCSHCAEASSPARL